jgi:hypothetical protein
MLAVPVLVVVLVLFVIAVTGVTGVVVVIAVVVGSPRELPLRAVGDAPDESQARRSMSVHPFGR